MVRHDGPLDDERLVHVDLDADEELDRPSGLLVWLLVSLGVIVGIGIGLLIAWMI
jgi:hypothetical protein